MSEDITFLGLKIPRQRDGTFYSRHSTPFVSVLLIPLPPKKGYPRGQWKAHVSISAGGTMLDFAVQNDTLEACEIAVRARARDTQASLSFLLSMDTA